MERRPVFIDCDPGIDDAVALMMAFQAAELDVRGISAVAGNVGLERTLGNALKIVELSGAAAPVYAGADRPMFGAPIAAEHFHGEDGLLGAELPAPVRMPEAGPAWEALRREAEAWGGALEVVATGPLTNLGIALSLYPELAGLVRCVTMMGGAAAFGNTTPAAEFNVLADPEAAELVFRSGIPVVMCGLDVTHKAYLTHADIDRIEALGTPQASFAAATIRCGVEWHEKFLVPGAPMHDPCAMLYALEPELFTSLHCWVGVECRGAITRGRTVTDAYSDAKRAPNTELVTDVDRAAFVEAMTARLTVYG